MAQERNNEVKTIEIYFADLTEQKQKELLNAVGEQSPEALNWDIYPVTSVDFEVDQEQED